MFFNQNSFQFDCIYCVYLFNITLKYLLLCCLLPLHLICLRSKPIHKLLEYYVIFISFKFRFTFGKLDFYQMQHIIGSFYFLSCLQSKLYHVFELVSFHRTAKIVVSHKNLLSTLYTFCKKCNVCCTYQDDLEVFE